MQANKLIRDLKPSNLVIPYQYTQPPLLHRHRTDLVIQLDKDAGDCNMFASKRGDVIKLPLSRSFEQIEIDSEVRILAC